MNWKALLNPWGEIRRLQNALAETQGRLGELRDWVEDQERRIYRDALNEFTARTRMLQAQNDALLKAHSDMVSLTPVMFTVPSEFAAALPPAPLQQHTHPNSHRPHIHQSSGQNPAVMHRIAIELPTDLGRDRRHLGRLHAGHIDRHLDTLDAGLDHGRSGLGMRATGEHQGGKDHEAHQKSPL